MRRCEYMERKTPSKNILEFHKHFSSRSYHKLFFGPPCIYLTLLQQNCIVQCYVDYELEIEMRMSLSDVCRSLREFAQKRFYTSGTLRSIRFSWFHNPLSWLSEISELKKGLIIWNIKGKGIWKIFIVVHKMPRYLLIHHAISFVCAVWMVSSPQKYYWCTQNKIYMLLTQIWFGECN